MCGVATSALASFAGGLGKSLGGQPTSATSAANGNNIDGAGFVVNFRGQQIASASPTSSLANPLPVASAGFGNTAAMVVLAVVGVVWFMRRKRGK